MRLPAREELEAIAARGGALALRYFRDVAAERKADRTLVTRADREVEALLVGELGALLPGAGIIGEEGAARPATGPYRIVIDPVDGTAAFVAGLPTWCVCIGILRGSTPVAGVVHLPASGETYTAIEDAAWWNGRSLPRLGGAAGEGDRFVVSHAKAHLRHRITYRGKVRALGSSAYHILLVARGAAEAALVGRAHLWDLVAPGAVLRAAGGVLVYLQGGGTVDLGLLADGRRAPDDIVAGAPATLPALLPELGGA